MIVLVDTSVWIRFLANRPPYAAEPVAYTDAALVGSTRTCWHRRLSGD
jgi:predicted nucleic acid-binding protein